MEEEKKLAQIAENKAASPIKQAVSKAAEPKKEFIKKEILKSNKKEEVKIEVK